MPLSQYFSTPSELVSLLKMKYFMKLPRIPEEENLKYCYSVLIEVSRSFAAVIQELPEQLRHPVCVFYLVLRALDTIEDDTKFPMDKKIPLLTEFYELMEDENFCVNDCGDKEYYRELLRNFPKVVKVYKSLDERYRLVIKDITKKMGQGMADFINTKSVDTVSDYNHYCYYVAGLVGLGLSEMFVQSGLENAELLDPSQKNIYSTISNQMGLFLQKTNIIRDYHEDILEDRIFWPKEVWSKHAERLEDFREEKNIKNAVYCLNELVTEAMDQIPSCIRYMRLLKDNQIFNFCAIPQVMAIATMAEIYNNPDVFRKNVKIRKGMAAELILNTRNADDVVRTFNFFIDKIEQKIDNRDPNAATTREKIAQIKQLTSGVGTLKEGRSFLSYFAVASFTSATAYVLYQYREIVKERVLSVFNNKQQN